MLKAGVSMVDMKLPTSLDRANHVGVLPCGLDGAFQHCRAESAEPNAWHSQPLSLWGQIQWRPTGVKGAHANAPYPLSSSTISTRKAMCTIDINCMFYFNTTKASDVYIIQQLQVLLFNTAARLSPIAATTTRCFTRFALPRDVPSFISTMPTPALSKCQILPI